MLKELGHLFFWSVCDGFHLIESHLSVDLLHCKPPTRLDKTHCDPANQCRLVRRTQPSSRTLDNPHLGLSGQTILVQHLTNYRLTGQSILYQLQTGWLVSIMILIVPIANWVASGYCNHCRPGGWNVLS